MGILLPLVLVRMEDTALQGKVCLSFLEGKHLPSFRKVLNVQESWNHNNNTIVLKNTYELLTYF